MEGQTRFISIDVEAVATGKGHDDRAPCWVAVVNEQGDILLDSKIAVENIYSPMTVITGVTREMLLEEGKPMDQVIQSVHSLLDANVTLVGQSPSNDIKWLSLEQGVHYGKVIDLATEFRSWNGKYSRHNTFGLAQAAFGLLRKDIQQGSHSPIEDAQVSMELFRRFVQTKQQGFASDKLTRMMYRREFKGPPSWKKEGIDGVCCWKFNAQKCFCGQPNTK